MSIALNSSEIKSLHQSLVGHEIDPDNTGSRQWCICGDRSITIDQRAEHLLEVAFVAGESHSLASSLSI